ncbi:L domain-like protein [Mycena floridula]|nr:L domain-like protein [Mycena floridula]
MSRIPTRNRSPFKAPSSPASRAGATTPIQTRTKSATTRSAPAREPSPPPSVPALSIKEAIALKRAEAKKAQRPAQGSVNELDTEVPILAPKEEDDVLGRWPVRETIERGRSSGSVNLATRGLPCIPSALFEIHLGINPDPLKSVPNEPTLPESDAPKRGGKQNSPAWFEAQDLQVLKVWNNEIVEIQHEISLFGSLKVIDLHNNKLEKLPDSFGDLTALTLLDVSHNALKVLPANLFALPELVTLNISHNQLTSLPFNAPFAGQTSRRQAPQTSGGFFTPTITRATTPLPRLSTINASHNQITASSVDIQIPVGLTRVDLSANPLGSSATLIKLLGSLGNLKELRLEHADIQDDAFPPDLFSSTTPFPKLRLLDLSETLASPETVKEALQNLKQEATYDMTTDDPPDGVVRILVGKKVIREAWEVALEKKNQARAGKTAESGIDWGTPAKAIKQPVEKESWETEALTEGAKRRLRAAAANSNPEPTSSAKVQAAAKAPVAKEAWEIEAEQGLLTEGGKRRARAAAAAAAAEKEKPSEIGIGFPPSKSGSASSLLSSQYYSQSTQTLALPSSAPPTKMAGHARAFSVAAPSSFAVGRANTADIAVPTATLPLTEISTQSFANTLKVLNLKSRRMDRSITLPAGADDTQPLLPCLEELSLEGCNFSDMVPVSRSGALSGSSSEMLLPLLAKLFPSLRTLDLSYNALTSASLTTDALSTVILATSQRKGLKQLRFRGNKINDLDGMQGIAELFKGNREVSGWKLDELDLRDNEIGKLPAELGLLPLDVFLVDGNTFRVPARRIWEREGTKGLLSWLRGRIE